MGAIVSLWHTQKIRLTEWQKEWGHEVAQARYVSSRKKGLSHKADYKPKSLRDEKDGACAELAASVFLGIPWPATVDNFEGPDLGDDIEVRQTKYPSGCLIFRPGDNEGRRWVLVTGSGLDFFVAGWCYGYEAKEKGDWKAPNNRAPAWFVPQKELRPMGEFEVWQL